MTETVKEEWDINCQFQRPGFEKRMRKMCLQSFTVERIKQKYCWKYSYHTKEKETSSWTCLIKFCFEIISTIYGLNISKLVLYLEDSRANCKVAAAEQVWTRLVHAARRLFWALVFHSEPWSSS